MTTRAISVRLGNDCKQLFLVNFADLHAGGPEDEKAALELRRFVAGRDDARWVQIGDWGEFATDASPQKPRDDRLDPTAQKIQTIDFFQPIAAKCAGWIEGNHPERMTRLSGAYVGAEVCHALGILDKYAGKVDMQGDKFIRAWPAKSLWLELLLGAGRESNRTRPVRYVGYLSHGKGGAALPGTRVGAAYKRAALKGSIDFVWMGHYHEFTQALVEREEWEGHTKQVIRRPVLVVTAGGLCKRTDFQEELALPSGGGRGNVLWFSGRERWVSVWDFPLVLAPQEIVAVEGG